MKNSQLKPIYDKAFTDGNYFSCTDTHEMKTILNRMDWRGLHVLEIGCGVGKLSKLISLLGAKSVLGVDYSSKAIEIANKDSLEGVTFIEGDYKGVQHPYWRYDVIVMQGVLEHLDDPYLELQNIIETSLHPGGYLITSSPGFFNPRGIVWMTFELLLGVKMSLTDLHQINPADMEDFCIKNHCILHETISCDFDWAAGGKTLIDFRKRFNSTSFQDRYKLKRENIDRFLKWLGTTFPTHDKKPMTGANIVYKIQKLEAYGNV